MRVWVSPKPTKLDLAQVLKDQVARVYPAARKVVLVVGNLNNHHPACLYERIPPVEARRIAARTEWHYIPVHASWLNMAECELSLLCRQSLKSRLPDLETVAATAQAWQDGRTQTQSGIDWRFTNEDARIKLV